MDKRVKYTIRQKHLVVRRILSGQQSIGGVARELGCHKSTVQQWLMHYQQHGVNGFKFRNGRYDRGFKLGVVRYYLQKGLSLDQTASYFKIPNASVIVQWVKNYECWGAAGLTNRPRGRKRSIMAKKPRKKEITSSDPAQKLVELQKELDYLRAENAFLKKFNALVQQEEAAKAQARPPKSSGN